MKSILGIDLGSKTLKAVEIELGGKKPTLVNYSIANLGLKNRRSRVKIEEQENSNLLKNFIIEGGFSTLDVVTALSENEVFTQMISLPKMSPKEVSKAIKWEAQQYLPLDINDVTYDFQILAQTETETKVLLVAAAKEEVTHLTKLVKDAGLEPIGIETTIQALSGLSQIKESQETTLVVNMGAYSSDLGIISHGAVNFTRSLSLGGETFSRSITEKLGIPEIQAEEYMKNYGLDDLPLEGKITSSVEHVLALLVKEMKRSIDFYIDKGYGKSIDRIILSGGPARLPGLLVSLTDKVGLETILVDPLVGIEVSPKLDMKSVSNDAPALALCIGLALGSYE